MSTNELVQQAVELPARKLSFDRTVDRTLVHKSALAEVFLTDFAVVDERRYVAAAQLPAFHAYFTDQLRQPVVFDPLVMLEAARQAVTYGAHVHLNLPPATTFMVSGWSLEVILPDALAVSGRPGELLVDTTATERAVRGSSARQLFLSIDLYFFDELIARASMEGSCVPSEQYALLRVMQRGDDPPTALSYDEPATVVAAPPESVLRRNPANVVVGEGLTAGDLFETLLCTGSYRNPSMFDHAYDHVPAMVLTEAARQTIVLARRAQSPDAVSVDRILKMRGRFTKFAELDAQTMITTRLPDTAGETAVSFEQGEHQVAEITMTLG